MGFPKIKDRQLFSQSKNRVFFMAKTTQNELIAKPSFFVLPQKIQQCSVALTYTHVCVCMSHIRLVYVLEMVRTQGKWFDVSRENTKGGMKKECELYPSTHLTAWLIKPGGEKAPFVL